MSDSPVVGWWQRQYKCFGFFFFTWMTQHTQHCSFFWLVMVMVLLPPITSFSVRFHWCRHFILYLHPPKIIRIEVSSVSCFFFVVVALLWLRFLINSSAVTSGTALIGDGSALSATSRSNTYPQRRGGHEPAYFRPNNVDFLQKSHLAIVFKISTIARRRCYQIGWCKTDDTTAAAASVAHCFSAIAKRHEGFPRNGTHDFVVVDVKSCIRYWDRCWMCPQKASVKLLRGERVVCRQKNRSSHTTASDTGRHIKSKEWIIEYNFTHSLLISSVFFLKKNETL